MFRPLCFTIFIFFVVSVGILSCNEKKVDTKYKIVSEWQNLINLSPESHPVKSSIMDLVIVSEDTLIAALSEGNILKSTDGGKVWVKILTPHFIKEMTIDERGRIWGLETWKGIHEPGYSRMLYSDDTGENWTFFELDTRVFWPMHFISQPGKITKLITIDNEAYRYKSGDPRDKKNWEKFNDLPKNYSMYGIEGIDSISSFIHKNDTVLIANDSLYHYLELKLNRRRSTVYDIYSDSSAIYIAGFVYQDGSLEQKALLLKAQQDGKLLRYDIESVVVKGVRKSNRGSIWAFGDGGIYLIERRTKK